MTDVPTVTARAASADELTAADYRDIYDELRHKMSLPQFVELLGSSYSIAWWSKYERGETAQLTRTARQELRRAVGLAPLPPTVAEAVASADPDATVYLVGATPADRLIMIAAAHHAPLTLRNRRRGAAARIPCNPGYTHTQPPDAQNGNRSIATWQRLSAARPQGETWDAFLARLLTGGA